jgi:hypothetical protein
MILKVYSGDIPTEETEIEYLEDNLPGYTIIREYEYDHASNIVMLIEMPSPWDRSSISGYTLVNTRWFPRWLSCYHKDINKDYMMNSILQKKDKFDLDKIIREICIWNRVEKIENLLS